MWKIKIFVIFPDISEEKLFVYHIFITFLYFLLYFKGLKDNKLFLLKIKILCLSQIILLILKNIMPGIHLQGLCIFLITLLIFL